MIEHIREPLAQHISVARLTMPRLPETALRRDQPVARLGRWDTRRLTCLYAPAGYGKTVLAAQLLTDAQQQIPQPAVAWLTAASDDDEPLRFVAALASALHSVVLLEQEAELAVALMLRRPDRAFHIVLEMIDRQTQPCVVVIDDLHNLTNSTVLEWLARAIEQSPPQIHWLLLSRREPPATLARLRLGSESRDLTARDLRVTRPELVAVLSQGIAQPIDAAIIDQLENRIQGWFAALQLACALLRYADADPLSALRQLPARLHGRQGMLVAYLSTEILDHLPVDVREFLLQCAIVPYLQADLCAAVSAVPHAAQLLRRLVQEQLLISALDDRNDSFVLHQLFREVLLEELRQRFSVDQIQTLYRRAADWFLSRGDAYQALRTLLDGGLFTAAYAQLVDVGRRCFRQARLAELQQLFALLQPEQIAADSDLLQLHAWLLFGLGDVTQMVATVRKLDGLRRTQPFRSDEGDDDQTALTFMVRVLQPEHSGLAADMVAALAVMRPTSYHAQGWVHLFSAIIAQDETSDDPLTALQASRQAFQRADSSLDIVYTAGLHALMLRNSLAPDAMLRLIRETLQQLEREQRPYLADETGSYLLTLSSEVAFWRDDIAAAAASLWQLRAATANASNGFVRLVTYLRLRACALVQPFDSERQALLEADRERQAQWWQAVQREASVAEQAQIVLLRIEYDHRIGRQERIWPAFQELGLEEPNDAAPDLIWQAYLAAHVLAQRDLARLTPLFERLLKQYATRFKQYQHLRLSIWYCLQQLALGEQRQARTLLRGLLPTIERTGYRRMLLEFPELAPLLKEIGTRSAAALAQSMKAAPQAALQLNAQQQRMIALIAAGADNARIAAEFAITIGTVKWHLNRLYRLLGVHDRRELLSRCADGSFEPAPSDG